MKIYSELTKYSVLCILRTEQIIRLWSIIVTVSSVSFERRACRFPVPIHRPCPSGARARLLPSAPFAVAEPSEYASSAGSSSGLVPLIASDSAVVAVCIARSTCRPSFRSAVTHAYSTYELARRGCGSGNPTGGLRAVWWRRRCRSCQAPASCPSNRHRGAGRYMSPCCSGVAREHCVDLDGAQRPHLAECDCHTACGRSG